MNVALVALHEFGHYFAGRLTGMQFRYMQIGAFGVSSSSAGKHLYRVAPWFSMNGFCAMSPIDGQYRAGRLALFILGGPLASAIVFGLVLLADRAAAIQPAIDWSKASPIVYVFWFATILSGSMLLACGVPFRYRGMRNDALLLIALTRKELAGNLVHSYTLDAAIRSYQRARDWGSALVEECIKAAENQHERLIGNLLAFYVYWDLGEREKAMERIRSAASECKTPAFTEQNRKLTLLEYAFALGFYSRDSVAAQVALSDADEIDSGPLPWIRHRSVAAVELSLGNYDSAASESKMASEALMKRVKAVTPNVQAELDWNEEIIAAAQAR